MTLACYGALEIVGVIIIIIIITIIIISHLRMVLCQIFSYESPKIRNLPKIFLRSFENVAPGVFLWDFN